MDMNVSIFKNKQILNMNNNYGYHNFQIVVAPLALGEPTPTLEPW